MKAKKIKIYCFVTPAAVHIFNKKTQFTLKLNVYFINEISNLLSGKSRKVKTYVINKEY